MQRAVAQEDKEARRSAILDAVETLFLRHPERMAAVAEVAHAAGLAKGTVYLYFPSKEEMLLALHERHVAAFFAELTRRLDTAERLGFDQIFDIARRHIVRGPGYLDLTSRCLSLMDREIPLERALEFKMRVGEMLVQAGSRLERHFPALGAGNGVALLCNSYGLMIGMWQLMHTNERFGDAMERPEMRMFQRDYETDVEGAVRAMWAGMLTPRAAAASKPPAKRKSR